MADGGRRGNGDDRGLRNAPVKCHLRFALPCQSGDLRKDLIAISLFDTAQAMSEGAVGEDGDVVLLAIAQQATFDGSVDEVVAYLVGEDCVCGQGGLCLLEIPDRKVTDANESHLA